MPPMISTPRFQIFAVVLLVTANLSAGIVRPGVSEESPKHANAEIEAFLWPLDYSAFASGTDGGNASPEAFVLFGKANPKKQDDEIKVKLINARFHQSMDSEKTYELTFHRYLSPVVFEKINEVNVSWQSYHIKAKGGPGRALFAAPKLLHCENVPLTGRIGAKSTGETDFSKVNCYLYYNREPNLKSPVLLRDEAAKAKDTLTVTLLIRDVRTGNKVSSFSCPLDAEGNAVLSDPSKQKPYEMVKQAIAEVCLKAVEQYEWFISKSKGWHSSMK